ncbi:ATP-binding protein, partial [Candidatus Omnitrophota bacterium]
KLNYETFLKYVHPEDREYIDRKWKAALKKEPYDIDHRIIVDGKIKWVRQKAELQFDKNGNCISAIGYTQDITVQKQAEEDRLMHLRFLESLEKINLSISRTSNFKKMLCDVLDEALSIFDCDRAWLLFPCDPNASSWTVPMERTKKEYPGVNALDVDIPIDRASSETFRLALKSTGPVVYDPQTKLNTPASIAKPFSILAQIFLAIKPKIGKPWLFGLHQCSHARIWTDEEIKIFNEIGHRLGDALSVFLSFEDLKQSEQNYRSVVEDQTEFICRYLPDRTITFANKAYCKYFGHDHNDAVGQIFQLNIPDKDRKNVRKHFNALGSRHPVDTIEHRIILPNGETRWQQWTNRAILDTNNHVAEFQCTGRDITERKIAEEELNLYKDNLESLVETRTEELSDSQAQLLQAEKLSSIGRLGAGVAHELNSPLTGLLVLTRAYKEEQDPKSKQFHHLEDMERACEHMARIVKELNAYARPSQGELTELNCNDVIDSTLSFSAHILRLKNIIVKKKFEPLLDPVRGEKTRLQQVILNLITNACDALKHDGLITISTQNCQRDNNRFVEVRIQDNGSGINKENQVKIFDPFFTTKRPGGGIGLGLSIVYKIIKDHNGNISVKSRPGKGCCFSIMLPSEK